jgi:uncharacterized protein
VPIAPIAGLAQRERVAFSGGNTMNNVDTVKGLYAAFGKGDIPSLLEQIAPDCDWDYAYASTDIPWLARRKGKEGVGAFFSAIGEHLTVERFEVTAIAATPDGQTVIALCSSAWTVKSTGKRIEEENEAHVWHFDAKGRIVRFRHCADTLQQHRALAK